MCGIAGMLHGHGRPVEPAILARMTDAVAHRGPDGDGLWTDGCVGLGHRRLAIRDLTKLGDQPMSDPSGRIIVVYNGEIYNDGELRRELERQGHRFRSHCDTEIIPAGYLTWGEDLFRRLEGIFALGLWDRERRRLVLARDHVGVKPLYFSEFGGSIRFASEIKGILADPEHPFELEPEQLHRFLALGHAGPTSTTVRHVRQVPPGTVMHFEAGRRSAERFWQPRRSPVIHGWGEALEAFAPLWDRTVADQLVSDVPVSVLLSGGIDSALLASAVAQHATVPLFTAAFDEASHDESAQAAALARHLGMPHHLVPIGAEEQPEATLARVVRHFDGQVADESAAALELLTRRLRSHSVVAMSGDGGDEFFGGYPTYRASRLAGMARFFLPRSLAASAGRAAYRAGGARETRLPAAALLARFLLGLAAGGRYAHAEWRRYLPDFLMPQVYGPSLRPFLAHSPTAEYQAALDEADGPTLVDRCLLADQMFHLPGCLLMKTDAMSMANGVEIRVPMLDRRIMEFAGSCDLGMVVPWAGTTKPLLRRLARRMAAPDAIVRAPKRGFNAPLARLLRGPLRPLAKRVFDREADRLEPHLDPAGLRDLWRSHAERRANHAYALWPILTLALWLQERDPKGETTSDSRLPSHHAL